ncbi:MAG: hypothetical protein U1E65_01760 [Myxococcota bacterium]
MVIRPVSSPRLPLLDMLPEARSAPVLPAALPAEAPAAPTPLVQGPSRALKSMRMKHDLGTRHLARGLHAQLSPGELPVHTTNRPIRHDAGAGGAYFRKMDSGASVKHQGIETEVRLPSVHFDQSPGRQNNNPVGKSGQAKPTYELGPLDRPSVYLGGHAGGRELDAGLSWDRVNLPPPTGPGVPHSGAKYVATLTDRPAGTDGRDPRHRFAVLEGKIYDYTGAERSDLKLSQLRPNCAFRPYWRTSNETNDWHNAPAGSAGNGKPDGDAYFYPGETVKMSVKVVGKDQVQLNVSGGPENFSTTFRQLGFGEGRAQSFKRVHSIDQFRMEGDQRVGVERTGIVPTNTSVDGGHWLKAQLLDSDGVSRPLTQGTDVRGREWGSNKTYDRVFHRSNIDAQGGEYFAITAGRR